MRFQVNKFKKFSPTKIVFGVNKLDTILDYLPDESKNVFIVTGKKSSKINKSLELIESLLNKADKQYFIFDKVEQNPSAKTINSGASIARKKNIDTVIGIGGGSPMDAAKCIAVLAKNDGLIEDYFQDILPENLPAFLIEIPTTAGSGSEVNQHAVISMATKKGVSHI